MVRITPKNLRIGLALLAVLCFRLLMGLSHFAGEDAFQVYLIGLQAYTTGIFPYFGPDVVYTATQIPGGLQGLLIAVPMQLLDTPEAPYFLLNSLSFAALVFFGWYITRRIPGIPPWFVYLWLLTAPWTLAFSTHIENPSYVLFGAILFFTGVFELGKLYPGNIIDQRYSFFFLGFALLWIMQLHLSWVLLPPFVLWVFYKNSNPHKHLIKGILFFLFGAIIGACTLFPTLFKYGISASIEKNIVFNYENLLQAPIIWTRFLSFSSYEVLRFIGIDNTGRINFIQQHFWAAPFLILVLLTGLFQVGYCLFFLFKKSSSPEIVRVKAFTIWSVSLICAAFLFSITRPSAHMYYLMFPVSMWYAFYCYRELFKRKINRFAQLFLAAGIVFQLSLFADRHQTISLFAHRASVLKAMEAGDYTLLGVRRESKQQLLHRTAMWEPCSIRYDSVTCAGFCNGFEVPDPYFRDQHIVHTQHYAGSYAAKVDSVQPYGAGFTRRLEASKPLLHQALLRFYAKTGRPEDYQVVCEMKAEGGSTWMGQPLVGLLTPGTEWQDARVRFSLPDSLGAMTEVKFYFWMAEKSGAILYVDNLEIALQ